MGLEKEVLLNHTWGCSGRDESGSIRNEVVLSRTGSLEIDNRFRR
jgi:hypothetical protein